VALPAGLAAAVALAPAAERLLFQGDVGSWLDGRDGSGFGGWVVAMLPPAAVAVTWFVGRVVNPWLRQVGAVWSPRRAGLVSLVVFAAGVAGVLLLSVGAAAFFDAVRLDTRGGLFGSYVQRNAMVVAVGMSFAIIPLVFTIADDALTSVPEHLRSASLGAGATPWQTAVRVIVPAAASGLFSAVMIGLGRAVGETMIVAIAAGSQARIVTGPLEAGQTMTGFIANSALGDSRVGSLEYNTLFAVGLLLFVITLIINFISIRLVNRFRQVY
jgi:phosphate transport system permease protein